MKHSKTLRIRAIEAQAWRRVGLLAGALAAAPSGRKEPILAELEFQHWLTEACSEAQNRL